MNNKYRNRFFWQGVATFLFFSLCNCISSQGQETDKKDSSTPPFVYSVEHTGSDYADPRFPVLKDLPVIVPLTDPFMFSNGKSRVKTFEDWSHRRAEIKAEIEHYEIGEKPPRPKDISATFEKGLLTVVVNVNGESLTLHARVSLPEGKGPFPAVIGIGRGTGSLPRDIFRSRKIATISYNFAEVMSHTQKRGKEPINKIYPKLKHIGAYSAWSWGVSRIIDGLELVEDELKIDRKRLAVTGCSFAGKMALFAGAFDERIALTIAQEPGGGGAAAWRVSETLGRVEKLGSTSRAWFMEEMFQFSGRNVSKLPTDHHELMAMVAPRALLVLGNPDYKWLADESGYVSCRAAHEVWRKFGIEDRFGFSIVAGHGHCQLPDEQRPEVEAFVDKFLLGKKSANTKVTISPFETVDYQRWIGWWGKGKPVFPKRNMEGIETVTYEAENTDVGSAWKTANDNMASNGRFIQVKDGTESIQVAPKGKQHSISFAFTIKKAGNYSVFARLNCPTADDDSFWLKVNDGSFQMMNGLGTRGWEWVKLDNFKLKKGKHTVTIAYREDGAKLDKISISNDHYAPNEMGKPAVNLRKK